MPWLSLALNKWTWIAIAFGILSLYAAVQHIGWQASKAELAKFEADTQKLAAEAKVKNAQIALQQAHAAQEALDDLSTRNAALSDAYARLRAHPGSSGVPQAGASAGQPLPGPDRAIQPDPDARCLAALEWGDGQLARFAELWRLQEKNASR